MKKNILIRILAALGGVTLWMLGLCALAETFFNVPVTHCVGRLLGARTPVAVLITLVLAIVVCVFGVCCLLMLSSKRAGKRSGFVMQKGENGTIGVSIKSIEGLVQTCVQQHDVVASAEIAVVERRDGIVILLDIQEAAGVNIPLAVGALQKQIKQYVNTCTGVDVHEVRVMVENTETPAVGSPYMVEKPMVLGAAVDAAPEEPVAVMVEVPAVQEAAPEIAVVEEIPAEAELPATEETVAEAETVTPEISVPVVPVAPVMPEIIEEEDDRPLHQRIFGAEEQPVFVPAPPELVIEPPVEEVGEAPVEASAEEAAGEETAEVIDANAVLEVVEAIAHEEEALQEEILTDEESFEYDEEVLAEEAILDGDAEADELKKEDREI